MGAGAGAQKITTDVTGNDTAGMVAGMVASGVTAKGLNGIEAEANKLAKAPKGIDGVTEEAGNLAEDVGKAGKGLEGAAKGAESAAEDAGKVVESGSKANKYTLTENLRKHIEDVDLSVPRKRGIGGAHNKNNFLKNDIKVVSITPNNNIKGVETIEYQMPKLDKTGTPIPGEYQGGTPKVKTVYDPDVISTDEYLKRGLEAANNASKNYTDGILPREWVGIDNQGVSWRGYCADGEISSMYPE